MNKHTVIVIIASFVIASPFVFAAWNIYAAGQLQFSGIEQDNFRFFDMINSGKIAMCNPLPFYTSFDDVNIEIIYEGTNKGTLNVPMVVLAPNSFTITEGKFTSELFQEAQYLAMHFDGIFSGSFPIRIDPVKMNIETEFTTKIFSLIPISVSKQYSGLEFWNMMNDKNRLTC